MFDVNPQGPLAHLRELERQAAALHRRASKGPGPFARLRAKFCASDRFRVSDREHELNARPCGEQSSRTVMKPACP
jgi:hypothetical protein